MKKPFKKQEVLCMGILTGDVWFINKGNVVKGKIFGKPYKKSIMDSLTYHVVSEADRKVYEVDAHAIDKEN